LGTSNTGVGVQNVTIQNIGIDANSDKKGDRPHAKGYYNCIHLIDSDNTAIRDCTLHDSLGDGLQAKTSANIKLYNNLVHKMGHECFYEIGSQNIEAQNNRNYRIITEQMMLRI
jgi:parallel beta-helix repeat protein